VTSRILAIVDSYDVMLNGRPYKKLMNNDEVISELKRCSGSQFDPELVKVFIRKVLNQGKHIKEIQALKIRV